MRNSIAPELMNFEVAGFGNYFSKDCLNQILFHCSRYEIKFLSSLSRLMKISYFLEWDMGGWMTGFEPQIKCFKRRRFHLENFFF